VIDAVFALGEDDIVRLLARVQALQSFLATEDGANLLAGYKRAANILKAEDAKDGPHSAEALDPATLIDPAEQALATALDTALPQAAAAIEAEDFTAAMAALASLRAPLDRFFTDLMVNAPEPEVRTNRLALLARFRDAVHTVADFSRIEG
jgi:glycyl-tRNA synthetase beta chain